MQTKNKRSSRKAQGIGDTIEQITEATGIKAVVKFLAGEDCGCEERKEKLNKLFPYKKPKCLDEDEYKVLDSFFAGYVTTVRHEQQLQLVSIYNRIFDAKRKTSTCSPCVRDMVEELRKVYNEYQK
jgi:hypothetical protein